MQNALRPARVWFNKSFSSVHGVLRQLRAGWGASLTLLGSHTQRDFGPLTECDVVEVEPSAIEEHDYVQWCLDFCARHSVDVFVPGRMREALSDYRADFAVRGTQLIVAGTRATLRLLDDKGRFLEQVPAGVAVPRFIRVRTLAEFEAARNELLKEGRRVCFKPSVSVFGLGFHVLDDTITPLQRLLKSEVHRISSHELRGVLETAGEFPELLVMEHLNGVEYSVDVLANQGRIRALVSRKKPYNGRVSLEGTSRTQYVEGGLSQTLEAVPDVEQMVGLLVEHFQLDGLLNVQFRSHAVQPERPHLLEINGRMSGGLPYIGLTGLNLPLLAVQFALHRPGEPLPTIPEPILPLRVQERSEVFAMPSLPTCIQPNAANA